MADFLEQVLPEPTSQPIVIFLNQMELTLGRASEVRLREYCMVSRTHASFQRSTKGVWFIKDLNSSCGVYVNGIKIEKSALQELHIGDVIGFGASDVREVNAFVCVLRTNKVKIKPEIIEISDDDECESSIQSSKPNLKTENRHVFESVQNVVNPQLSINRTEFQQKPSTSKNVIDSYHRTFTSNSGTKSISSGAIDRAEKVNKVEEAHFSKSVSEKHNLNSISGTKSINSGAINKAEKVNKIEEAQFSKSVTDKHNLNLYNSIMRQESITNSNSNQCTETNLAVGESGMRIKNESCDPPNVPDDEQPSKCFASQNNIGINQETKLSKSFAKKTIVSNQNFKSPLCANNTVEGNREKILSLQKASKEKDVVGVKVKSEPIDFANNEMRLIKTFAKKTISHKSNLISSLDSNNTALKFKEDSLRVLKDDKRIDGCDFSIINAEQNKSSECRDNSKANKIYNAFSEFAQPLNEVSSAKHLHRDDQNYSTPASTALNSGKPFIAKSPDPSAITSPYSVDCRVNSDLISTFYAKQNSLSHLQSPKLFNCGSFSGSHGEASTSTFAKTPIINSSHSQNLNSSSGTAISTFRRQSVDLVNHNIIKKCFVSLIRCDATTSESCLLKPIKLPIKRTKSKFLSDDESEDNKMSSVFKRQQRISSSEDESDEQPTFSKIQNSRHCLGNDPFQGQNVSDIATSSLRIFRNNDMQKTEANASHLSIEDACYSQDDDVVIISDDETYLDFSSSHKPMIVKTEPLDEYEENFDNFSKIFEEMDSECDFIFNNTLNNVTEMNHISQEAESIEKITAFVQGNDCSDKKLKRTEKVDTNLLVAKKISYYDHCLTSNVSTSDESNCSDSSVDESNVKILHPSNFALEKASKTVIQSDAPNMSLLHNSVKDYKFDSVLGSKPKARNIGKTLFTEPKPISFTSLKSLGREGRYLRRNESFSEKQNSPEKMTKKQKKAKVPNSPLRGKKSSVQKQSMSSKVLIGAEKKLSGFRIPKKRDTGESDASTACRKSREETVTGLNNIHKKNSVVKRRPDNFSSRGTFLTEGVPTQRPKKRCDNTIPSKASISKSSELGYHLKDNQQQTKKNRYPGTKENPNPSKADSFAYPVACKSSSVKEKNIFNSHTTRSTDLVAQRTNTSNTVQAYQDPRLHRSKHISQHSGSSETFGRTVNLACSGPIYLSRTNLTIYWYVLERIVNLNTKWLQEQVKQSSPPPDVSQGVGRLPLSFESFESYKLAFMPMLMLELWEIMFQAFKPIYESNFVLNKFYFKVLKCDSNKEHNMIELTCESPVNEKESFLPAEGNIVIVDILVGSTCKPYFGYVYKHKIFGHVNKSQWKMPSHWLDNSKLVKFWVLVKKKESQNLSPFNRMAKGSGLCHIKSRLRLFEMLSSLKSSPLLKDILKPSEKTFSVKYSATSPSREYSHSQKQAIKGIVAEIKSPAQPKIILLRGPPGTGKTHTIIGLIESLLYHHNRKIKLLVTAPSNAAIDEICGRLIVLNKQLNNAIKFVRIGRAKQINKNVQEYSLDEKVKKMFDDQIRNEEKSRELEIEKEYKLMQCAKHEELKQHKERIEFLKGVNIKKHMDACTEINYKKEILWSSNIVLSTLNSCSQSLIINSFNPNSDNFFTCCIVDEATQCTEPEVLQPLMFGINKLILVGDDKQLPATVISKLAKQNGFERSLFERFYLYFQRHCQNNPMLMLTQQFRMHSQICQFPSKYFYNNLLKTVPGTDVKYACFPLHPYIFLDMKDGQESSSSSKINQNEALSILSICAQLLQINNKLSLGIITPYRAQQKLYSEALHPNPLYRNIEVNTVDGFQGREKDIIIVSCVRANNPNGSIGFLACPKRLNVAITRARQCLIICGHIHSLSKNSDWRALISDAQERELCITITSSRDIPIIFHQQLKRR